MTEGVLVVGALLVTGGILAEVMPSVNTDSITRKSIALAIVMAGIVILEMVLK
jgi:hypothetical protein